MSKRRNVDLSAGKDGSSSVDAKGKSPSLYRRRVLGQDATNYVMKAKDRFNDKSMKCSKRKPSQNPQIVIKAIKFCLRTPREPDTCV